MQTLSKQYIESRRANTLVHFDLYSHLQTMNARNPEYRKMNGLSVPIEKAMLKPHLPAMLFDSPCLAFLPIFSDIELWRQLAAGNYDNCYNEFATYKLMREHESNIGTVWANKVYLNYLMSADNKALAPIHLGITKELSQFLNALTPIQANNIANFAYPLFKFRFDQPFFNFVKTHYGNRDLLRTRYFHALMATCPNRITEFSPDFEVLNYRGEEAFPLIKVLIQNGMRASVIGALFPNIPMARIRGMFKSVFALRSVSGMKPVRTEFFFSNQVMRTHATFLRFLFNLCNDSFHEYVPSLIHAYLAYKDISVVQLIELDRFPLLLHSSITDSSNMTYRRCNACGTQYLISTTQALYELDTYHCISCVEEKEFQKRLKNQVASTVSAKS